MLRAYELMVIIDGEIDDPRAQAWIKTVTDGIVAAGGSIHGRPDLWGKRQFAYPIHRKETGYYLVIEVLAEGGALNELERTLRLADEVVRHKLLRLPDRVHESSCLRGEVGSNLVQFVVIGKTTERLLRAFPCTCGVAPLFDFMCLNN